MEGWAVRSQVADRRRLLTLLAGFFGFAITAVFSVIPGTTASDVVRARTLEVTSSPATAAPAAQGRLRTVVVRVVRATSDHGVTTPARELAYAPPSSADRSPITGRRSAVLPTLSISAVRLRGPPSGTGL